MNSIDRLGVSPPPARPNNAPVIVALLLVLVIMAAIGYYGFYNVPHDGVATQSSGSTPAGP